MCTCIMCIIILLLKLCTCVTVCADLFNVTLKLSLYHKVPQNKSSRSKISRKYNTLNCHSRATIAWVQCPFASKVTLARPIVFLFSQASPFTREEEGSGQLRITVCEHYATINFSWRVNHMLCAST